MKIAATAKTPRAKFLPAAAPSLSYFAIVSPLPQFSTKSRYLQLIRCTRRAENRANLAPMTVGGCGCKSKLQKEYAGGTSFNQRLLKGLRKYSGYFFHGRLT